MTILDHLPRLREIAGNRRADKWVAIVSFVAGAFMLWINMKGWQ